MLGAAVGRNQIRNSKLEIRDKSEIQMFQTQVRGRRTELFRILVILISNLFSSFVLRILRNSLIVREF